MISCGWWEAKNYSELFLEIRNKKGKIKIPMNINFAFLLQLNELFHRNIR